MNKFEALKQFMAWPPEWQRLCAEYWAETDEGSGMRLAADREILRKVDAVWTTADKIQATGALVQRDPIPMPSDQPKAAAKVAAVKPIRNCMAYTSEELSEVDSHLVRGLGPTEVAKIMMRKHKGHRTKESWRKMAQMAQYIRKRNSLAAADRSIDAEVK